MTNILDYSGRHGGDYQSQAATTKAGYGDAEEMENCLVGLRNHLVVVSSALENFLADINAGSESGGAKVLHVNGAIITP